MASFTNQMNQASNMYNDGVLEHNKELDEHLNNALDTIKNSKEGKIADVLVHTGDAGKEAFYSTELSEAVKNYKKYANQYKVDEVGHVTANKNYLTDKFNSFKKGKKNNDDVDEDTEGTQVTRDSGVNQTATSVPETDGDQPLTLDRGSVAGRVSVARPRESLRQSQARQSQADINPDLEDVEDDAPTRPTTTTGERPRAFRDIQVREDPRFRLSLSDDAIDTAKENKLMPSFQNVSMQRQIAVRTAGQQPPAPPSRPTSPVQPEPEPAPLIEDRNKDTGTENSGDTGAKNEEPAPNKSTDTSKAPVTNEDIEPQDTPAKSLAGKLKTAVSDKTGISEEGLDVGMYGAKKIIGGTMGVVSTISDISQGKLSGDNTAEKVGDVLGQIGAYTDLVGTAIPVLEPLGALVGIAGGLATGIGHIEDDIEEHKKLKEREQDVTDKTNALKDSAGASFNYNNMGLASSMSRNPRLQLTGTSAF